MQTLISACLAEIEFDRRQFRGQREVLAKRYWESVQNLFAKLGTIDQSAHEALSASLTRSETGFLFGIARGAAISSVRSNQPNLLGYGLRALALDNLRHDYRETLIDLTLLDHSAKKLDLQLADIYALVRPHCRAEFTSLADDFFTRSHSLGEMQYIETVDKHGAFIYRQAW